MFPQRAIHALALIFAASGPTALHAAVDVETGLRAYDEGNFESALIELREAAAMGHAEAQRVLGVMHLLGQGVRPDPAIGARWIQSAARLGNAGAQELMSYLCSQGIGVSQDHVQAYAWLKLVALRTTDAARAAAVQATIARLTSVMSPEERARAKTQSREYYSKFLRPYL
jgi:TPR repeat protein